MKWCLFGDMEQLLGLITTLQVEHGEESKISDDALVLDIVDYEPIVGVNGSRHLMLHMPIIWQYMKH